MARGLLVAFRRKGATGNDQERLLAAVEANTHATQELAGAMASLAEAVGEMARQLRTTPRKIAEATRGVKMAGQAAREAAEQNRAGMGAGR